jgi:hypothetical protein
MGKRESVVEHSAAWHFMQNNLPLLITVLGCTKGKEVSPEPLDKYLGQFSESDVCMKCRVDAAFEVQEKLKYWRRVFVNLDSSPYLGKMGVPRICTCKRPPKRITTTDQ